MTGSGRCARCQLDVLAVISRGITGVEGLEGSPVLEAEVIALIVGVMHAEGSQAGIVAVDNVEQQTTVGELIEGQGPLGQHRGR
ncbi:hypothetical protein D3C76_1697770 [compost metagenome]